MTAPEFSRLFDVRQLEGKSLKLEPTAQERAALAQRFPVLVFGFHGDENIARSGPLVFVVLLGAGPRLKRERRTRVAQ